MKARGGGEPFKVAATVIWQAQIQLEWSLSACLDPNRVNKKAKSREQKDEGDIVQIPACAVNGTLCVCFGNEMLCSCCLVVLLCLALWPTNVRQLSLCLSACLCCYFMLPSLFISLHSLTHSTSPFTSLSTSPCTSLSTSPYTSLSFSLHALFGLSPSLLRPLFLDIF